VSAYFSGGRFETYAAPVQGARAAHPQAWSTPRAAIRSPGPGQPCVICPQSLLCREVGGMVDEEALMRYRI
jgi:hypothetical protein